MVTVHSSSIGSHRLELTSQLWVTELVRRRRMLRRKVTALLRFRSLRGAKLR